MKITAMVFITIVVLKLILSEACSFVKTVYEEEPDLDERCTLLLCVIVNMIIGTLAIVFSAIALF